MSDGMYGHRDMLSRANKKTAPRPSCKKEMTLDCPFRNPLQSRVISVLSYYLTSYGYLRFYWIRSAAFPQQSSSSSTTISFVAVITAQLLICEDPRSDSLPACCQVCRFALTETACLFRSFWRYPDFQIFSKILKLGCLSLAPSHGRSQIFNTEYFDQTLSFSCWGSYLYIGLTFPLSGYNLPH